MTALDLEAIRKRAAAAICHHDEKSAGRSKHAGPRRDDCGCENCMENRDDLASDAFALCDEVELLRVENAKLREIIDEDLSGRPLEFLLHEIADRLHYEGGGSMEDCVRDKEEKILAYRALADLALRSGGG